MEKAASEVRSLPGVWRATIALVLSAAIVAACSHDSEVGPRPTPEVPEAIATATRLAAGEPGIAPMLRPRPDAWHREGRWTTSPGWRAAEKKRFDAIGARLPENGAQAREVGLSRFERFRLRVTPEGARGSAALELHEGRVLYRDVWPSTDEIVTVTDDRYEELLLLKDKAAPREFVWRLEVPRGIAQVRQQSDGAIDFVDGAGALVLRAPPAVAVDAAGTKIPVEQTWSTDHLVVRLGEATASYPVLIDPAFEKAFWERKTPATNPPPRDSAALAYDSDRHVSVLFGGENVQQPPLTITALADTWEWDGTNWAPDRPSRAHPRRSAPRWPTTARGPGSSSSVRIPGSGTAPIGSSEAPRLSPRDAPTMRWRTTARAPRRSCSVAGV